jgi:hypothetical protein
MSRPELYLLGAGVQFPSHLTLETLDVLNRCNRVYTNLPDDRLSSLPPEMKSKWVSLWSLYIDGRERTKNYQDVIDHVLAEVEKQGTIAWVTRGHPVVFDSVTTALARGCRTRDWSVTILPAISSIDTMLALLEYEPASGLLIHEASGVVQRGVSLDPNIGVLLFQPGVFLSNRAHINISRQRVDLTPLRNYLLRFYRPEHKCAFVYSVEGTREQSRIWWVELHAMADAPPEIVAGATLFITRQAVEQS